MYVTVVVVVVVTVTINSRKKSILLPNLANKKNISIYNHVTTLYWQLYTPTHPTYDYCKISRDINNE